MSIWHERKKRNPFIAQIRCLLLEGIPWQTEKAPFGLIDSTREREKKEESNWIFPPFISLQTLFGSFDLYTIHIPLVDCIYKL